MSARVRAPTVVGTVERPKGGPKCRAISSNGRSRKALEFLRERRARTSCRAVIQRNEREGVTWLHSYVSEDGTRTFCVYDGPSPEAIRRTATDNELPLDAMTEVRVLDPYLYF